jgi:hypothetical protein
VGDIPPQPLSTADVAVELEQTMTLQPLIAPRRVAEGGARVKESVVDSHLAKTEP